jgi:hypothetical protein
LNSAVETFGDCIGYAMPEVTQESTKMVLEHSNYLLDRFQSASNRPRVPVVKEPFARTLGWPIPEIAKVLFHGPGAPRLHVTTLGGQKFMVTVFIEVVLVEQP